MTGTLWTVALAIDGSARFDATQAVQRDQRRVVGFTSSRVVTDLDLSVNGRTILDGATVPADVWIPLRFDLPAGPAPALRFTGGCAAIPVLTFLLE